MHQQDSSGFTDVIRYFMVFECISDREKDMNQEMACVVEELLS